MDLATDKIIHDLPSGEDPEQFALHPDNRHLYIANEDDAVATVVDTQTRTVVAQIDVGVEPEGMAVSYNGKWAIGGTVSVIDVESRQIQHVINFEIKGMSPDRIQPVGIELTADGKHAFIALGPSNHVAVVDRETYEPIEYILVGRRVWHTALTPEQDKLYTTNGVSGDVSVVDIATMKAEKSIKVGRFPWGAAILPKDKIPG